MKAKTAVDIGLFLVSQAILFYGVKWIVKQMDPLRGKKDESRTAAKKILKRLGLNEAALELNEYETVIANEIVHPEDISVGFGDIGGLEGEVESLREAVIYPLTLPQLYGQCGNHLISAPKGVLLYGPPGCGKTLIAKALARDSGAVFINLHVSTLTEKWFGESQKLVRAVFSLAHKLQPAIIFIDEIDAFLRERQSSDHEVTGMMKAEFMSLWDGLFSSGNDRVLILGATNRLYDIDKAILRRMPRRFPITLPNVRQRERILEIMLRDTKVTADRETFIKRLARLTNNFSGSDLKELCSNAALAPVKEYLRKLSVPASELPHLNIKKEDLRPVDLQDFIQIVSGLNNNHNNSPSDGVVVEELLH